MTVPFIYNFRSLSNKCPTILCLIFPSPGLAISLAAVSVIYGAENGLEGRQLSRDQKQFCQQRRLCYYN